MCGRYVLFSDAPTIRQRFQVDIPEPDRLRPNYNISPGDKAPVITNQAPNKVQFFQFGLNPYWAKKPMYLFNARSEGNFNPDNEVDYKGQKGIIQKPSFKKPIRSQRCLIPVDYFIEGTTQEKLNKPHLVYLKDLQQRPFALAGIWDEWLNQATGELIASFAIITTVANALLQRIPHHRSPVILPPEREADWLADIPLNKVLDLLQPYPAEKMNAYLIDQAIKNPRANGAELIEPISNPLVFE